MAKNVQKKHYYDVEIIFTDGTSDILNYVTQENTDNETHQKDLIFVSKDGTEILVPSDKTIFVIDYYALDGKGNRKRTRPNIEYCNFDFIPRTEEERKMITEIEEMVANKFILDI
jgi:hypothetical protein